MDHVKRLVDENFGVSNGELAVGAVPVSTLVREFGSPLYVYSPEVFHSRLTRLRAALPEFDVYYSLKANPTPAVISEFVARECGLEIASGGELSLALRCGCPPTRVIFAGPGKTDAELAAAVRTGVAEIHIESANEVARLATHAAAAGRTVGVVVRVNLGAGVSAGAIRMGGRPTAFGVEEAQVPGVTELIVNTAGLTLRGFHTYAGTQILDVDALMRVYRGALQLALKTARMTGRDVGTIDFGGGFGVPYSENEDELDIAAFGRQLAPLVRALRRRRQFAYTQLLVEPGRYLVAEAGLYVTTVVDCKTSCGRKFVVLNGGINHHLAASGALGQVLKRNFPIAVANRMTDQPTTPVQLVGPLCTPLDTMARDIRLPEPKIGDAVVFFQSGAYARSASPLSFLSRPEPPEVFVQDGHAWLVRRSTGEADVFRGAVLAPPARSQAAVAKRGQSASGGSWRGIEAPVLADPEAGSA